ncbi:MAG: hypothetical protein U5N21_15205 [Rhodococcus sp. (in: high G+C Gram-positive bacteria)]|nr:hypothetical protein [Rhodococcus sp. (in: high G+C Gram-positive bacteria)]
MNTRKQYASVVVAGIIGLGIAALVIWLLYSGNDGPNSSRVEAPHMPISLGTFLISLVAILTIALAAVMILVEVINPRRVERAHRKNLLGGYETTDAANDNR